MVGVLLKIEKFIFCCILLYKNYVWILLAYHNSSEFDDFCDAGNGGLSSQVLIAIIVSICVAVLLFIVGFCWLRRRATKKYDCVTEDTGARDFFESTMFSPLIDPQID